MVGILKINISESTLSKQIFKFMTICLFIICYNQLYGLNNLTEFENEKLFRGQGSLTVFSISQDSAGFIWIGSNKGLFRYDGINYKRYTHRDNDPESLFSNVIFRTCVDPQGVLWFSGKKSFGYFDPVNDSFQSYNRDSLVDLSPKPVIRSIYNMVSDSSSLWLGFLNGNIYRFDKKTGSLTMVFSAELYKEHNVKKSKVSFVNYDNKIYCSFFSEIYKINKKTYSVEKLNIDNDVTSGKVLYPLFFNKKKKLLAGNNALEILYFEEDKLYDIQKVTSSLANFNSKGMILDIQEGNDGNLWIATSNHGLVYYNIRADIYSFSTDPKSKIKGIDRKHINTVFIDNSGAIWVGTSFKGLYKSKRSYAFSNIESIVTDTDTIKNDNISFMDTLNNGNVLCYIKNEGLVIFDPNVESFITVANNTKIKEYLSADIVNTMTVTKDNIVWFGSRKGLIKFDLRNNQINRFIPDQNCEDKKYCNFISAITETNDSTLWLGTYTGHLYRFNIYSSTFLHRYLPEYELSFNRISQYTKYEEAIINIEIEDNNTLWISTSNSGLALFDIIEGKCVKTYVLGNSKEKVIYPIKLIKKDSEGKIWTVAGSHGFFGYDKNKDKFIQFIDEVGLISRNITSITEDSCHQIWLGTPVGAILFDKYTNTFTPFDISKNFKCYDITQNDKYLVSVATNIVTSAKTIRSKLSGLTLANGTVVLSGPNGLTYFNPSKLSKESSQILLSDFEIFSESQKFPIPVNHVKEIKLSYRDYIFSFEYRITDYNNPKSNKYAFWLEGFEKEWNYTDNDNKITYFNILPGKYIMKAKGCNSTGTWNEQSHEIALTIMPPFWQTWWFRISVGLSLVGLIGLAFWARISNIQKQKKLLEVQVQQRTEELYKSEEEYRDLFDNAYDVIWISDIDGNIQAINHFFQEMLGYSKKEIIGTNLLNYINEEHRFRAIRNYLKFRRDQLTECELNYKTRDNGVRILWLKVRGIYENGSIVGIHGIGRDSTELKKAQAELREAERIKRESMKQLTLKLAHEIKNPLTCITSSAQLVAASKDTKEKPKIQRHMNIINKNVNICNQVIRELYSFTHKPKINFSDIQVSDLIKDLRIFAENRIGYESKIKIVSSISDSDIHILGDKFRLEQAFANLINNAVDAITEEGTLTIDAFLTKKTIIIEISDTGCGMLPETLENIYKPFYTSKSGGFGLGMPVVKDIIDAHQGTINIISKPDQGSTFRISFNAYNK